MALYNIAERLSTAKELISRGDDASLIYAALELRFCLESVAYQNLAAYGEDVSTELAREWRPDQIIKMLAAFDPNSDQTASFSISVTPPPKDLDFASSDLKAAFKDKDFLPIGEAKRIPWGKFRSYYNSLGSFLHLRKDLTNARPKIERLRVLIAELEEVASSTLIAASKDLATGKCVDCGHVLILGPAEQAGDKPVFCPNTKCNSSYLAIKGDPERRVQKVEALGLRCECEAIVPILPERLLKPAVCPACGSTVCAVIAAKARVLGVAGGHLKIVALEVSEHVGGHLACSAQVRAHAQGSEGQAGAPRVDGTVDATHSEAAIRAVEHGGLRPSSSRT